MAMRCCSELGHREGPGPMEIPDEDLDAEQAQANGQIHYVLVMLVLKKAESAPVGRSSEVWRLLVYEYEPKQRRRSQAILSSVLRAKLPDPLRASITLRGWSSSARTSRAGRSQTRSWQ
ncbi:unnamed protein product [Prorocentrum cordatum]|uniref:Uncharacterized protein n=1 Tax=Prorocentrum cordatum TaxID=2364126 RepID=A0ABN9X6E5_9DINO|nr:unnamed protein product [Polarella glacialis]